MWFESKHKIRRTSESYPRGNNSVKSSNNDLHKHYHEVKEDIHQFLDKLSKIASIDYSKMRQYKLAFQIAQMISQNKNNPKLIRMLYLYGEPNYKQAINNYILNLVRLIQKTFQLSKLGKKLSPYKLENDQSLNLPFSRWQITKIINEIKFFTSIQSLNFDQK